MIAQKKFDKISGIYAIICNKTWRSYVGSSVNIESRKYEHFLDLKNGKHINKDLQLDFNKFGHDSFFFEILEEVDNVYELIKRENNWIKVGCNLYNKSKNFVPIPQPSQDDINKFWSKVDKKESCWIYPSYKNQRIPRFYYQKSKIAAYRFSYKLAYPDFDESLIICHKCDNPQCVNPEHLFLGTQSDNMKDMSRKGRNSNINFNLAKSIREKYFESEPITSRELIKWVKSTYNIDVAQSVINAIMNNTVFIDNNFIPPDRKELCKNWRKYNREGLKISDDAVSRIRELHKELLPLKEISNKIFEEYGYTISKTAICAIARNKIRIDHNYEPIKQNKIKV